MFAGHAHPKTTLTSKATSGQTELRRGYPPRYGVPLGVRFDEDPLDPLAPFDVDFEPGISRWTRDRGPRDEPPRVEPLQAWVQCEYRETGAQADQHRRQADDRVLCAAVLNKRSPRESTCA